jgi:hypothetical protein
MPAIFDRYQINGGDKMKRSGSFTTGIFCFVFVALIQSTSFAGAPVLTGANPTLTPAVAMNATNPAGYDVSSFLTNSIVTDGTQLDDFEDGNNYSQWGGQWFTFNDVAAGGLSVITPFPFTAPSAGGYNNSAYCGKITIALHVGTMTYNPYLGVGVNLNPTAAVPPLPVDLTKATGFRYWYKGSKHYFKVETSDINPGAASFYQDSMPASAVWRLATFTWDSLHSLVYATGVVNPVLASSKSLANILDWVVQGADGTIDSLFIDNVEVTGFSDRGIAVTGADNSHGAWQFSTNAGANWNALTGLSDNTATLLNLVAKVRFVPTTGYSGPATFVFRAWNQTDGKANGATGQAVVPNGGVTAYSALFATGTVQVQNSNIPVITTQPPATMTVNEGASLTLNVAATNATTYQWEKDGAVISGATVIPYNKIGVVPGDAGSYTVMVKNATDSVISSATAVTVVAKPGNVVLSPVTQTVLVAGIATFTVTATGTSPFTYQWKKNGVDIPGKTSPTLIISPVLLSDSGFYTVAVTNAAGSTMSNVVSLIVAVPDPTLVPVIIPYQPNVTQERRPLLLWHPVANASTYTFIIDDNADFSSPIASLPLSDTTYKVQADLPFSAIYWKVKSNLADQWSAVDHFTVLSDSIPDLVRYNGGSVSVKRPVFEWHPVVKVTDYKIEIANNRNFANATTLTIADTAFTPLADLGSGMWYWHVSCSRNYALFAPVDSVKVETVGVEKKPARHVTPSFRIVTSRQNVVVSFTGYDKNEVIGEIYSARGELTAVFSNTGSGQTMVIWNGKDQFGKNCANGVYVFLVRVPGKMVAEKIVVQR